jgi:membrane fusion protein (multidrug efflux system)
VPDDTIANLRRAGVEIGKPIGRARVDPNYRRRLIRLVLLTVGPLLVVIASAWVYLAGGRYVSTDDAYVKTHLISINAQVAGQVTAVNVRNNQRVAAGDPLFEIDPASYQIALAQAEADLANTSSQIASLRASYLEKTAMLRNAEANIRFQQTEYNRQTQLQATGNAAQQRVDQAKVNLEQAQQQADVARQQMAGIQAQLGGDVNAAVETTPQYKAALARRDNAALALSRTRIVAPTAGVVANVTLRPGDYIGSGVPIFSLAEADQVWIDANFKETDLTHVTAGQAATIKVDTYPGITWTAKVESISPASGGEFSILPAQNSSGNWVKVVQRIPVRLVIDPRPDAPQLRAGMSVSTTIDTGHRRSLADLF